MQNRLMPLLKDLVGINSISPTLSGGPGEAAAAEYVANHLKRLGIDAATHSVAPGRDNVTATIAGSKPKRSILLNAHLDTVGAEGMETPFALMRQGDKLYGLGAYDMKGSVAVMLLLAEHLVRHPPPVDVLLTFVADEEDKSIGMEHLVRHWLPQLPAAPEAAVFLEPTEEQIGIAHKGFTWFEVAVLGKAAHGSRPEEGIDAILPLRAALAELAVINSELACRPADPLLGRASVHGGVIKGGSALSVIPARARLRWERRTLPGEEGEATNAELKRVTAAVEALPGKHRVRGRELFVRPPYRIDPRSRLVERMRQAAPQSTCVGLSFWADSALCRDAGVPAILYGPVGHGAHAVDEWVSLKSLERVYEAIKRLVAGWR